MASTTAGSSSSPSIPNTGNWDPMVCLDEQPTPSCLLRVTREIADIEDNRLPGIFVSPEESDVTRIHAVVMGPEGTPYEGGFFHFFIKCPSNYPFVPPRVRLMTTDAGRVSFNPHLYACGKVCLSILGTWPGPTWTPAHNIRSLLISIQSLMIDEPFFYDEFSTTCNALSTAQYNDRVGHDTVRVAVCDAVEAYLGEEPPYPPCLVSEILKKFAQSYEKYEERIEALAELDSARRLSQTLDHTTAYLYEPLLSRLRQLGQRVKEKIEVDGARR
ncbi:ubiquitin-conjugating enzyme E2 Z [Rhipicephalus sanguineus]|uniref:Ubiquitin-conjugating enzyme E2 Z n=1 Tax=Rhipicephalus sanguineus TaxID=34632 RepID=A0A9D4SP07_RHISA|nr:ubiquitin-conjugating enzyme E2 Z [Rhipicephalus sanguineus]KAH7935865.1 hypothetical protein HPB52_014434 [Rhipicephalus sanguineus]